MQGIKKDEISKQNSGATLFVLQNLMVEPQLQFDVVFFRQKKIYAATTTILVFHSAGSEHNLPTTFPLAMHAKRHIQRAAQRSKLKLWC